MRQCDYTVDDTACLDKMAQKPTEVDCVRGKLQSRIRLRIDYRILNHTFSTCNAMRDPLK